MLEKTVFEKVAKIQEHYNITKGEFTSSLFAIVGCDFMQDIVELDAEKETTHDKLDIDSLYKTVQSEPNWNIIADSNSFIGSNNGTVFPNIQQYRLIIDALIYSLLTKKQKLEKGVHLTMPYSSMVCKGLDQSTYSSLIDCESILNLFDTTESVDMWLEDLDKLIYKAEKNSTDIKDKVLSNLKVKDIFVVENVDYQSELFKRVLDKRSVSEFETIKEKEFKKCLIDSYLNSLLQILLECFIQDSVKFIYYYLFKIQPKVSKDVVMFFESHEFSKYPLFVSIIRTKLEKEKVANISDVLNLYDEIDRFYKAFNK